MISFFRNNPDFLYYVNFIVFILFGAFALGVGIWSAIEFNKDFQQNFVAGVPELNLPRYYGSCAGLTNLTYRALENNRTLTSNLEQDNNKNKLYFKVKVIGVIANAFTYSSTCQDTNALGLMLTSDANITLDAAFNQLISFNEAVPLARSYYNEANLLGYYQTHKLQGFLLQGRIDRNSFRVKIKAPF